MTEQPQFHYFACYECDFSSVQRADFAGSESCPLCSEDKGDDIRMGRRIARDTDRPEGYDARGPE